MDVTEGCFLYVPGSSTTSQSRKSSRPNKKRKISPENEDTILDHSYTRLWNGTELPENTNSRAEAFDSIWTAKQDKLERVLHEANSQTVEKIAQYIAKTDPRVAKSQIPAGLVTSGLATSSSGSMYEPISSKVKQIEGCRIICIPAAECPNLKTALKTIVKNGTNDTTIDVDDDDLPSSKARKLLNYDLESLQEYNQIKKTTKCVLFFQNSEALDGQVLGDLVDLLCSWQDRIPSILMFEIAVSVDLFQEKLSRRAIRQLNGTTFESKSPGEILDLMFRAATSPNDENPLYLGAGTSRLLLDRQEEHIQSAKGFTSALKYMYMTHFYFNPLSALLAPHFPTNLQPRHLSSIRNLQSIKKCIANEQIEDPVRAEKLGSSDEFLVSELPGILSSSRVALLNLLDALQALHHVHQQSASKASLTWSSLYTKAMSGTLSETPLFAELLNSIRILPSDSMTLLLAALSSYPSLALGNLTSDLEKLLARAAKEMAIADSWSKSNNTQTPICRSAHDPWHATTRTTMVGNKISLEKKVGTLSPLDKDYTKLVGRIHSHMRDYFMDTLLTLSEIPLSEVLVFDTRRAIVDVLGAAPRETVELALERPGDYLDCKCCRPGQQLSGTMPATSILWQLVQEAGIVINVEDLWKAFRAIVSTDTDEGVEETKNLHLTLFYRSLAELRHLGIVKNSRKRADHLMKMRWKGL